MPLTREQKLSLLQEANVDPAKYWLNDSGDIVDLPQQGTTETALKSTLYNAPRTALGFAGAAVGTLGAGLVTAPSGPGAIAAGAAGSLAGSAAGSTVGQSLMDAIYPSDWRLSQEARETRNPGTVKAADIASSLALMRPSLTTMRQAAQAPMELIRTAGQMQPTTRAALANIGVGAGISGGAALAQGASPGEAAFETLLGGLQHEPTMLGRKASFGIFTPSTTAGEVAPGLVPTEGAKRAYQDALEQTLAERPNRSEASAELMYQLERQNRSNDRFRGSPIRTEMQLPNRLTDEDFQARVGTAAEVPPTEVTQGIPQPAEPEITAPAGATAVEQRTKMKLDPSLKKFMSDWADKFTTTIEDAAGADFSGRASLRGTAGEKAKIEVGDRAHVDVHPHEALHIMLHDALNFGSPREQAFVRKTLGALGVEPVRGNDGLWMIDPKVEETIVQPIGEAAFEKMIDPRDAQHALGDFMDYYLRNKVTKESAQRMLSNRLVFGSGSPSAVKKAQLAGRAATFEDRREDLKSAEDEAKARIEAERKVEAPVEQLVEQPVKQPVKQSVEQPKEVIETSEPYGADVQTEWKPGKVTSEELSKLMSEPAEGVEARESVSKAEDYPTVPTAEEKRQADRAGIPARVEAWQKQRVAQRIREGEGPGTEVTRPEVIDYSGESIPANVRRGRMERESAMETPEDLEMRRIEDRLSGRERSRYQPLGEDRAVALGQDEHEHNRSVIRALQPDFGGVPESERVTSRFVRGDSLSQDQLLSMQADYEKWAKRAGIEPTSLIYHVGEGNAVVWSPHGTEDRIVGQFIGDVFSVSHFAPKGQKTAVNALLDLLHTETPVVFAVPEKLADQLSRLGFRESSLIIPMHFRGTVQQKHLMANKSVTENDVKKLAAWWTATAKLNGLYDEVKSPFIEQAAQDGLKLIEAQRNVDSSEGTSRYQPLGPDRGEYKGQKLPEREQEFRGIFAGNVEALRRSGDPEKAKFADTAVELYARIRNYTGKYEDAMLPKFLAADSATQRKVVETMYDEDQQSRSLRGTLNAKEAAVYDEVRAGLAAMRRDQIAANQLIDGRPAKLDPHYFPNAVDRSVIHDITYNPTSQRAQVAERQFVDFNADLYVKQGLSRPAAEASAREAFNKFVGSLKPMSITSGFDFGAVSLPSGTKLPPTWIAADPVQGFRSYIKRFARARAFYDVIGRDPEAMRLIGRTSYYDAKGNEIDLTKTGSRIVRDPNVRALLENAIGVTHESQEGVTPALGRLANTLLLSNVMSRVTDAVTTPFKALTYLPPSRIPGLLLNLRSIRNSVENAYRTGGLRRGDLMVVRDVLGAGDAAINRIDKISELITKYTGSEAIEKGARILAQNVGEYVYDVNHMLANKGDKRALAFFERMTPKWRTIPREEMSQRIAQLFQGSYDATNLPIWIQNSPAAPFFSMMKWNVEQWNNFKRHAWEPAKQGDVVPLVSTVLGGIVGGLAIGELREAISGKKQRVASFDELAYGFSKGDKLRASAEAMRKAAFISQVTGTLGVIGELNLQVADMVAKDKPQGFSWPAYDLASNVVGKAQNAIAGLVARPQDASKILTAVTHDLARDVFSQYRIASSAVDRAAGQGETEEANRRRDLRMSEKLRGAPVRSSPLIRGDYANAAERAFDKERDIKSAAEMAKSLRATAISESKTRAEREAAMRKLKSSRISGIPSKENDPRGFRQHMQYIRDTQGEAAATELLRDYNKLRREQQIKSKMFR